LFPFTYPPKLYLILKQSNIKKGRDYLKIVVLEHTISIGNPFLMIYVSVIKY